MKRMMGVVVLMLFASCGKPNARTHMRTHFDGALDAQSAVIAGQPSVARAAGQGLADHREGELPRGSKLLEQQMVRYARGLAGAKDISEAAFNTAGIAETCGTCHRHFGPGPRFTGEAIESGQLRDVSGEMRRHVWAVGRLWEGLVGPSDEAWMAGARVLADAPLIPAELLAREGTGEGIVDLERRVHELGRASLTATPSERTVVYSNLIATCATCHSMVQGGGG